MVARVSVEQAGEQRLCVKWGSTNTAGTSMFNTVFLDIYIVFWSDYNFIEFPKYEEKGCTQQLIAFMPHHCSKGDFLKRKAEPSVVSTANRNW